MKAMMNSKECKSGEEEKTRYAKEKMILTPDRS
jgi:hypothetical protein